VVTFFVSDEGVDFDLAPSPACASMRAHTKEIPRLDVRHPFGARDKGNLRGLGSICISACVRPAEAASEQHKAIYARTWREN
jgi:hypothetical protein